MHFVGGLQGIGSLPGVSTFAAGRPAFHIVRISAARTITTLQWGHDAGQLIRVYSNNRFSTGTGEYVVMLPVRPRYNGAKVVYPFTHKGYVLIEEAGKYSIQPPGTTPVGSMSIPLDDSAVGGIVSDRSAILKGLGAGPAISPFQPRAGAEVRPVTSQTIATPEVRAAEAAQWGAATKVEQDTAAREAAIAKWGPPVAVISTVAVIAAAWFFMGRKK